MSLTLTRPTIAQILKHQTEAAHQDLEALMMPWLQGIATRADYALLLKGFYGYFAPLEDAIAPFITTDVLPDGAHRRKASSLLSDLSQMEVAVDELTLATRLPQIQSLPQALGALYVMEGSTLGGRGITKMLQKKEGLHLQLNNLQFFNGYGDGTGPMWTAFVNVLNSFCGTDAEVAQMVASANQSFLLFKTWLQDIRSHD
jgi:heme oxygenase